MLSSEQFIRLDKIVRDQRNGSTSGLITMNKPRPYNFVYTLSFNDKSIFNSS